MKKEGFSEVLLVGFDFSNGRDRTVMTVGHKPEGKTVVIDRAIKGPEAVELYKKLTGKDPKEV